VFADLTGPTPADVEIDDAALVNVTGGAHSAEMERLISYSKVDRMISDYPSRRRANPILALD
jgi:hypothetical protein